MNTFIAVLLGGAAGTGLRYGLYTLMSSRLRGSEFPFPHLVINVSGSFLIGVLAVLFESRFPDSPTLRLALMTGVLGGYTTFSSFSLENYALLREGQFWLAALNISASVFLGLAAVWAGVRVGQMV